MFHHFAPGQTPAKAQIAAVDAAVARIHALEPERQIYLTADHGMNKKTVIVNFQTAAERAGFSLYCLAPLKDRYVENHIYQEGGMLYVFLRDKKQAPAFYEFARRHEQVEQVLKCEEAAAQFHLPADRIGDYVLFSAKGSAFGEVEGERIFTEESRTHGSLYEREIPLIAINPEAGEERYRYHMDIAANLWNAF